MLTQKSSLQKEPLMLRQSLPLILIVVCVLAISACAPAITPPPPPNCGDTLPFQGYCSVTADDGTPLGTITHQNIEGTCTFQAVNGQNAEISDASTQGYVNIELESHLYEVTLDWTNNSVTVITFDLVEVLP